MQLNKQHQYIQKGETIWRQAIIIHATNKQTDGRAGEEEWRHTKKYFQMLNAIYFILKQKPKKNVSLHNWNLRVFVRL